MPETIVEFIFTQAFFIKMKKIIIIFLLLIYTGSAFGITVDYHYCSGHLTHVTVLNFGAKGGCKCNSSEMPKGCCKDKMLYMKGDEHKSSPISFTNLQSNIVIDIPAAQVALLLHKEFFVAPDLTFDFAKQKSPPSIFLLNGAFRI